MKKDRNCGCGGNMYPTYQQPMMPMYQQPMMYGGMPMNQQMMTPQMMPQLGIDSNMEQQLSNLNSQVTSLERRVRALESLIGGNNSQYNTSNYQMM